jgi:hypothetical protein
MKRTLLTAFASTPFRLCCTATPAPNDHMELGNHSEFLGLMPANEMLMRWFINDTMNFGTYRLKKHAAADFWRWVASWAVCASRPSDVQGSDDGFLLPALDVRTHVIDADYSAAHEAGALFALDGVSATTLWRERSGSLEARIAVAARLVLAEPDEPWVIWVDTNEEADAICELVPDAVEVRGSDSVKRKEAALLAFAERGGRLATKSEIAGFGMNWQHCARMVFVGVTYSFERTYQALRRSWRFGQARPVIAHLICAEGEVAVLKALQEKQAAHAAMQRAMARAMREEGLLVRDRLQLTTNNRARISVPEWLRTREVA